MKIVGVHGIGQTYRGEEMLKVDWLPALRDGVAEARGARIPDDCLEMVSFGALFRREGTRDTGVPKIEPDELTEWEQEMLVELWRESAKLSACSSGNEFDESMEIQGPDFQGRARTPRVVQRALRQLSKSKFFSAVGAERMLLFGLRQVRAFLHDPDIKASVLQRVHKKVTSETKVIVAHSLGSIVAYEALCMNDDWHVDTLITLGSPLGIRNLVFDALTPKPKDGRAIWPRVRRWVNIVDQGDIVALEKHLAPYFGNVEDKVVYNGWHSHDVTRYLCTRETGEAISAVLGES